MTEKKSIRTTLIGIGTSSMTLLGIGCGGGLCAAACGAASITPIASFLGLSTAGLSNWTNNLLPLLTAISSVTFTIAYFSLYKKKADSCCEDSALELTSKAQESWAKTIFWISLFLSVGFYGKAMADDFITDSPTSMVNVSGASCSPESVKEERKTSSCSNQGER